MCSIAFLCQPGRALAMRPGAGDEYAVAAHQKRVDVHQPAGKNRFSINALAWFINTSTVVVSLCCRSRQALYHLSMSISEWMAPP